MYQNLVQRFEDSCWKIKSLGGGFWSVLISFGYKENESIIYLFSLVILIIFLLIESGIKIIQYKYIKKSLETENTLNEYLIGEKEPKLPNSGISTNIKTPEISDFFKLFLIKRWLFWLPYLSMFLISFFMYLFM